MLRVHVETPEPQFHWNVASWLGNEFPGVGDTIVAGTGGVLVKFAVSDIPLFIATVSGLELLFTVPVKPLNW
jgi:hypothetical protein